MLGLLDDVIQGVLELIETREHRYGEVEIDIAGGWEMIGDGHKDGVIASAECRPVWEFPCDLVDIDYLSLGQVLAQSLEGQEISSSGSVGDSKPVTTRGSGSTLVRCYPLGMSPGHPHAECYRLSVTLERNPSGNILHSHYQSP